MLEKLVETIEQVKSRMKEHGEYLEGLEWRTRIVLIDPLLKVLGWDVTNPKVVNLEHSTEESRFDYAFCDESDKILMIVEAKKFNDSLLKIKEQLGKYSLDTGVPYFLLTNGSKWIFYNMDKPGKLEDRVEFEINLQTEPTSSAALSFLSIWRKAFLDTDSSQPLPKANKSKFSNDPPKKNKTGSPPSPPPEPQPGWFILSDYLQEKLPWPPKQIRFPDGTIESVADKLTYKKSLQIFIKYLFSHGKIVISDLPISLPHQVGGKPSKHVAIRVGMPSDKIKGRYSKLEWNSEIIWFYSNYSRKGMAKKIEVFSNEYGVNQISFSS